MGVALGAPHVPPTGTKWGQEPRAEAWYSACLLASLVWRDWAKEVAKPPPLGSF